MHSGPHAPSVTHFAYLGQVRNMRANEVVGAHGQIRSKRPYRAALVAVCALLLTRVGLAQDMNYVDDPLAARQYDVLRSADGVEPSGVASQIKDHPLIPALRYTYVRYVRLQRLVRNYTGTVYQRERIDGALRPYEVAQVKVRHQWMEADGTLKPYSVYLRYVGPANLKGREALFVKDHYLNRLIITRGGSGSLANITLSINPKGNLAMSQNRHPITRFGLKNVLLCLIERGMNHVQTDKHPDEWDVRFFKNSHIGERQCTCIQVRRKVPRDEYSFQLIRVFFDDALHAPVRYASYSWPRASDGKPVLDEQYTYTNIRLNVGLQDVDFDVANQVYGFDESRIGPRENVTTSSTDVGL